jgi:Sigma-70, region 4/Bacterial RNA polymerase, alpha chain C terminal domain
MLRSSAGEWDIQVSHSFEDVLHAWSSFGDEAKSAVLHVGFERRVARSFEDLASQFPGMVLLTPGAKGALPGSFTTSKGEIGSVNDESIFLALEGWGYAASEPTRSSSAPSVEFSGWIRSFLLEHPQHTDLLTQAGVFNDDSYLELECTLGSELRSQIGLYRSNFLVGDDGDDPVALARAAPPWLASQDLNSLDLTVRIGNVFRGRSLKTVSDIGSLTVTEMLTFQNFGRTSIQQLNDIFHRALLAGPRDTELEMALSSTERLLDAVHNSLATCSERERDILVRRMGLERPVETLAEIGDSYGITRERIRQIEAKVVDRLVRREIWDDVLASKLQVMLADREFPLPLIGAEAIDPWFSGVAAHREAIRYLIANMCNAAVHLVEIDGIEYLSFLSQDVWQEIVASSRQILSSGVDNQWTEQDCQHYVKLLVPDEAREFGALLWEIASKWCHFADDAGERTLISYGRGVDQVVEAVLLESDQPLHYSEITVKAAGRGGREMDERRVHNAAAEVGYLFGSGIYGMLKHMSVPRTVWESLAEEAYEIITEGPLDRQWHTSELIDALAGRGVGFSDNFDKYQLDIALKEIGQLHSLGRMVWTSGNTTTEGARVDIRQAVIAILQSAGEPLSTAELRQRVVAVRGINQGMEFQVRDPLIKLDSQLWALNDRDLSIKRSDQPAFLDSIVNQLRARMKPAHITECSKLIGDVVPARALFCLAAADPRLRVTQDRFLTLSEW